MKKNRKAMTLLIAIILTIIMVLISIYIIDFIIPFLKNVKNIENTSKAYYQAQKGIERSLLFVRDNFGVNKLKSFTSNYVDYGYDIVALGNLLPILGQGNSEFDKNFNRIRIGESINLEVGKGYLSSTDWQKIKFYFRIPNIGGVVNSGSTLKGGNLEIINWQLVALGNTLNTKESQILAEDISNGGIKGEEIFGGGYYNNKSKDYYNGVDLEDNTTNFVNFYHNNCEGTNSGCILKMSVINKLEVENGFYNIPIPYLEWKIDLRDTGEEIPLRYTQINSEGKSYGFKKDIDIRYPQQAVNEAFDFTVFQ